MTDQAQPLRRRVVFHGHVQGVFFRATTLDLAAGWRVVGHVRNQPDGTVELETEGLRDQVEGLVDAVTRHFRHNITRIESQDLPARGAETAFQIRY